MIAADGTPLDTAECLADCTIPDDTPQPYCGDGNVDTELNEECDDGANGDNTDGCTDACKTTTGNYC